MSNLTFDHRLLKEHTPEPLEGHAVVVFERVGEGGDKLHSVLLPGAPPVKPGIVLFGRKPEYFAYAADTAPERHLDFTESMRLADHVSEFRVVFNLAYSVADPRALARERNADPLRKVRDQARVVIKREVEQLPWQAVWENFPHYARMVVEDCMEELREISRAYGIAIRSLRLSVRLPDAMESKLVKIRDEALDRTVRGVDGRGRIEDEIYNAAAGAVGRGDMATAEDLMNRIPGQGRREVLAGGGGWNETISVTGAWPGRLAPGAPGGVRALPASTGAGEKGLEAVLADVVAATLVVRGRIQRLALRSALLHLAAELLVDDAGDGAATVRYAERARSALQALDPSPGGAALDALKALADPDQLRDRLE
ncbi:hypothetical protein [Longimicrobium terrae]|uniref:Band 7 domain-containing protein n=1 Tax=Longimicrobium terrae TaxID=1639882 RepID=A0A841H3H9_9BACT|nr:hypothetical protein [Longimicrobium terrae]MBB4638130.1 hypothetical protein [Longimicrobium terrae]MBB6072502.1 hypothetical protein [Longimicrobium terrae]NNC32088.1 hypothetical protein [Longimicrobium terrae]